MALIEFAPLRIPLYRRIETLAVVLYYYSFYFGALLGAVAILLILFSSYYPLALLYLGWAYLYDSRTPSHGGRRSSFMRHLKIWKHFKNYFPIEMVKTADLNPDNNYIFGYHPHGILCAGAFCCFATEATEFEKVFPGVTPHLLPLLALFRPPLFRDYLMSSGMCDVSRESCNYILSEKGPGNSICIVVGGAAESLDSHPDQDYYLILKQRRGFIRLALQNGAHLVPVFAFCETNLFNQVSNPRGSRLREIQLKIQKMIAFAPILFYGRGIFQYTFGMLPFRRPVHVVVGKPIAVKKIKDPTNEEIEELHEKYIDELRQLFDENKEKYHGEQTQIKLIIE
eukprot:gene11362-12547_t